VARITETQQLGSLILEQQQQQQLFSLRLNTTPRVNLGMSMVKFLALAVVPQGKAPDTHSIIRQIGSKFRLDVVSKGQWLPSRGTIQFSSLF
jgi:hypothetical protein